METEDRERALQHQLDKARDSRTGILCIVGLAVFVLFGFMHGPSAPAEPYDGGSGFGLLDLGIFAVLFLIGWLTRDKNMDRLPTP